MLLFFKISISYVHVSGGPEGLLNVSRRSRAMFLFFYMFSLSRTKKVPQKKCGRSAPFFMLFLCCTPVLAGVQAVFYTLEGFFPCEKNPRKNAGPPFWLITVP